jgi:ligand-binding SRPBCC domain-containing protein
MPRFHFASLLDAPVERVFAFHKSPGALERLLPPRPAARVVRRSGGLEPGSEVEIELRIGPFRQRWVALHTEYRENEFFCDVQKRGPFRLWRHRHGFEPAWPRTAAAWSTRWNSRCRWRRSATCWRRGS